MHAPAQETSNSLVLDLVSRFLSKILTNDPNITHYMKQWSTFQDILTTVPFSLSTAFSHITTVTPLEHAKPTLIRPSPITEINSIMRNLSTDLNGSFDALPSVPKPEDKVQRRRGNSYGGPQDAPWSREDAGKVKPSRFAQHISSASTNDSATRKMFNILPDDIVSGNSVDYSDSGSGYFSRDLGLTSTVSKHYLSSLAARAKKLKDNIENNTDKLLTLQNINANAVKYNMEERSPLRKLKVYERQADNSTGAYNFGLNLNPVSDYGSNQNNNYMQRLKLY